MVESPGRALSDSERRARVKYETNRVKEAESSTLEALQVAARAYLRIHAEHPGTYHGERAAVDYGRLYSTVVDVKRSMFHTEELMDNYLLQLSKKPMPEPPEAKDRQFFRDFEAALQP